MFAMRFQDKKLDVAVSALAGKKGGSLGRDGGKTQPGSVSGRLGDGYKEEGSAA